MIRPSSTFGSIFACGAAFALIPLLPACSSSTEGTSDPGAPGIVRPAAACPVEIETFTPVAGTHVPEGTIITYTSNPPSSGPHYPVWANFQEFERPLDEGYLVHSLEHGAIALLYKCATSADAECAANLAALRKIRDAIPTDPSCDPATRVRVVIAPAPRLDRPVAAAAWGKTYKGDCVDVPTLTKFANDNYAKSPENLCVVGRAF